MAQSWFHSRWKIYSQIFLIIFILSLLSYVVLLVAIRLNNNKIAAQNKVIEQQNQELSYYKSLTGYNKLIAVKLLEEKQKTIPRYDHISKVIQMLEDLKNVNLNAGDNIALSDFNVSLDKISLKWKVSNLLLLYYSDEAKWIQSLIDRFASLDFIKNMRIQTYDKITESWYFQFVLEANVINDGGTK